MKAKSKNQKATFHSLRESKQTLLFTRITRQLTTTAATMMTMMSRPTGRGAFSVAMLLFQLLLLTVSVAASATPTTTTFVVFDNGASTGGATVTLAENDFPTSDDAEDAAELFALKMTQLGVVNVTKFGQPEGTVRASKAFREDGELIVSYQQLLPSNTHRIYLVAEGLEFVWPFIEYGHRQIVSPQALEPLDENTPVIIESVSDSPRVFRIFNFFTKDESQALIDHALAQTGDKALKRSTVGSSRDAENRGASQDIGRTSENSWDNTSPAARKMITRSFNLTGIPEDAGKVDGLQIVRYMPGNFYNTHPDYFTSTSDPDFDFYPYSGGSNRFATVFMYIADPEEGGATVFPSAPNPDGATEPPQYALDMFREGSLEQNMVRECHSKLAVEPAMGTAALFYSVKPDGQLDPRAMHGACPVIKGVKWGANIWIWNRQRYGEIKTGESRTLAIHNQHDAPLYLTWEGKESGVLAPFKSVKMNTFEFHRFKIKSGSYKGDTVEEFTVQSEPLKQEWTVKPKRQLSLEKEDGVPQRNMGSVHSEL